MQLLSQTTKLTLGQREQLMAHLSTGPALDLATAIVAGARLVEIAARGADAGAASAAPARCPHGTLVLSKRALSSGASAEACTRERNTALAALPPVCSTDS